MRSPPRIRKRIEEVFGWAKTVAGLRKMRHRGRPKVDWPFTLAMAAYDLVRLSKLPAEPAPSPRASRRTLVRIRDTARHRRPGRPFPDIAAGDWPRTPKDH